MSIKSMRIRSCRSFKVDGAELPAPARERLLAIRRFDELRAAGCGERAALKEIHASYLPMALRTLGRSLLGNLPLSSNALSLSPCGVL